MKKWILICTFLLSFSSKAQEVTKPTSGSCAADGEGNTCVWAYDEQTKTLTISGQGKMKTFTTPWSFDSNQAPWSDWASTVKNIIVGEGITDISTGAFAHTTVENVSLPESLETIGLQAFSICRKLGKIEFPSNLRSIQDGAFQYVPLKNIDIPVSVEHIGCVAFTSDTIESITLSSATTLGDQLFWDRGSVYPKQALNIYCKGDVKTCEANIKATFTNNYTTSTHPVLDTKFHIWRNNRRIYTIEEAEQDAGEKNTFRIKYR